MADQGNHDGQGKAQKDTGSSLTENVDPSKARTSLNEKPKVTTPAGSSSASENGDLAVVEKAEVSQEPLHPPRDIHGIKWGLAVFSILISTFLFALDNTIVADVQPAIVERFGDVNKLPWLAVAFLVTAAGTNLVW